VVRRARSHCRRLTLALITGFLMYFVTIAASLGGLAGLYGQLRAPSGGAAVFELIDTRSTIQDAADATTLPASQGRISFENVCFSYEDGTPVIQDVSLESNPARFWRWWPERGGQEHHLQPDPRFYDPTSGVIRIDGRTCVRHADQSAGADGDRASGDDPFGGTIRRTSCMAGWMRPKRN